MARCFGTGSFRRDLWLRTDFRSGPGGGYAAATPTTDGKLVYCAFGSSVIAAIDYQGEIVWRKEIVPYTFDVTLGSSPVLYENTLILFCAMSKSADSKVLAFAKTTGQVAWEQKLPDTKLRPQHAGDHSSERKAAIAVACFGHAGHWQCLQRSQSGQWRTAMVSGRGDTATPAYGSGYLL